MPDLKRYREKRDAQSSPEPFGDEIAPRTLPPGAPRSFVVQQHDARNMHWDLRLEIDGVLVSWAVPRGPSLDPEQKRLAVQTEDHPLEYAEFEGMIPRGNYGAGAMIVWDRGAYRNVDGRSPAEGLDAGKLDLLMEGHKLRGRFALVRTKGEDGRSWLLIRKGAPPEEGAAELVESEPGSVLSGLRIDELREGVHRGGEVDAALARLHTGAERPDSATLRPMLATAEERVASREGWLYELKYDGVRVLAAREPDGGVRLFMRTGRDATHTYPEIARAVARLPLSDFVLDGEIVAMDERGRSSFERIQRRFTQSDPEAIARLEVEVPTVYYAFDLLQAQGRDLRRCPLTARKQVLSLFTPRLGDVRFADHIEGDGAALFEAAREHDLEGVVAKRADSRYESGRRARTWLKSRVPRSACFAIVGFVAGRGSRTDLGSLMLAWHRDGALHYAGNAGSGLDEDTIAALLSAFEDTRRDAPAFEGEVVAQGREKVYVEPRLVAEVRFTEVTSSGMLRHPVFVGLREDVALEECQAPPERAEVATAPAPATPREAKLELTRLDKVFWPVEGYTKGDLLAYYEAVWPWLEPHLRDRPVVLTRYPDGIEGKHFYQKNAPGFTPDWARRENIEGTDYFLCNDLRTLLYVINSGAIPLHVWHSRLDDLDRPDWLVLDLDPKEAPFADVLTIARHIHRLLDDLGAPHFAKTSGQDGMHVLLPLGGQLDHAESRALGEVLARTVAAELPEIATVARPLAARADKVYVDFLQNGRGKLIASALSVRPRPGAPVSMPLTWRQVTARLDPRRWNIKTAISRLQKDGDPSIGVLLGPPVDVAVLLEGLERRLAAAS